MSTEHEPPFNTPAYNNYLQLMNQTPTKEQLKERQLLCKDLEVLCTQDSTILEEVIDEYVYLLNAQRIEEMQEFVNKEMESDY